MAVTVVFAPASAREEVLRVDVDPGATLAQVVASSGLAARYPAIDFPQAKLGVWGKTAPPNTLAAAGDRIEIYRPLVVDPKVARLRRAAKKRQAGPAI
jgi:putative ubiquitin-RnfH superfamily antitoxin RatB of RatAB toxin-antitoxin module